MKGFFCVFEDTEQGATGQQVNRQTGQQVQQVNRQQDATGEQDRQTGRQGKRQKFGQGQPIPDPHRLDAGSFPDGRAARKMGL